MSVISVDKLLSWNSVRPRTPIFYVITCTVFIVVNCKILFLLYKLCKHVLTSLSISLCKTHQMIHLVQNVSLKSNIWWIFFNHDNSRVGLHFKVFSQYITPLASCTSMNHPIQQVFTMCDGYCVCCIIKSIFLANSNILITRGPTNIIVSFKTFDQRIFYYSIKCCSFFLMFLF